MRMNNLLYRMKTSGHSIYARLVFGFLAVLFPLLVLGYSVYNWGLQAVKDDITTSSQAQVDFYRDNLDRELQRIRLLQFDLFNDTSLNALEVANTNLSDYERDMNLKRVQERIVAIKSSSRYVSEVKVLLPVLHKNVSNIIIDNMSVSDEGLIHAIIAEPHAQLYHVNGQLMLLASSSMVLTEDSQTPSAVVAIVLSESDIRQMLHELQTQRGSHAFLIGGKPGIAVFVDESQTEADPLPSYVRNRDNRNSGAGSSYEPASIDEQHYALTYGFSKQWGLTIVKYVTVDQLYEKINHYRWMFGLYAMTALFVIVFFALLLYRFIHAPLTTLVKAFYQVEIGNMKVEIKHRRKDEFRHIFTRFNAMIGNLNALIDQVYKQGLLLKQAEFKQLQTQINPHFLYNSFFVLHRWIKYGYNEEAELFSRHLGNYFQFVTRSSSDEVPLEREVEHARTYVEIQAMRFSNRIRVRFDELPNGLEFILVPRLILQPIIENAFEHGLEDKQENGLLAINFHKTTSALHIIVEDNGEQMTDEKLERLQTELSDSEAIYEITGLLNIHKRLLYRFGGQNGLSLGRSEVGGLKITLTIPIEAELGE